MKQLTILIFVILSLAIFSACGEEHGEQNDVSSTTVVSPGIMNNSVSLAHFLVSSISLSQRMLLLADVTDTAINTGTTNEACPHGGSVAYTFTSGTYPVTITYEQCVDDISTISGTLRFDTFDGNRSIEFLSDMNVNHAGKQTVIRSGTTLLVNTSENNPDNQTIYLALHMESNGSHVRSDDLIFINLYQDGKNFVLYDGNISIAENMTFAYDFPSCGASSALCVSSPTQVYHMENGVLTVGEGSEALYFKGDDNLSIRILIDAIDRLRITVYDGNDSVVGNEQVDISDSLF